MPRKGNTRRTISMPCPVSGCTGRALVIEVEHSPDGRTTKRRRKCNKCGHRFNTIEFVKDYSKPGRTNQNE